MTQSDMPPVSGPSPGPSPRAPLILSVIVPVYNEEPNLERVIRRLMSSPCPIRREWIFVDDCSKDGSLAILKRLAPEFGFRVVEHQASEHATHVVLAR